MIINSLSSKKFAKDPLGIVDKFLSPCEKVTEGGKLCEKSLKWSRGSGANKTVMDCTSFCYDIVLNSLLNYPKFMYVQLKDNTVTAVPISMITFGIHPYQNIIFVNDTWYMGDVKKAGKIIDTFHYKQSDMNQLKELFMMWYKDNKFERLPVTVRVEGDYKKIKNFSFGENIYFGPYWTNDYGAHNGDYTNFYFKYNK